MLKPITPRPINATSAIVVLLPRPAEKPNTQFADPRKRHHTRSRPAPYPVKENAMPHWLVIDLEATTEEGGWPLEDMEIIEIGASLVGADGHEVDHFQRFVRPARRPCLTG